MVLNQKLPPIMISAESREMWSHPDKWIEMNEHLHITSRTSNPYSYGETSSSKAQSELPPPSASSSSTYEDVGHRHDKEHQKWMKERLVDDGYVLNYARNSKSTNTSERTTSMEKSTIDLRKDLVTRLASGITRLHKEYDLPATFILLYDEAWYLAALATVEDLSPITHPKNMFNYDLLAWYIDPKENMKGFAPHRDRQPDSLEGVQNSFYDDGQAKYTTMWMALTDATPENSCLYVIPKQFDPGYAGFDDEDDNDNDQEAISSSRKRSKLDMEQTDSVQEPRNDPLSRALPTKESYQAIRALPCRAGESVIFTHRILHWGSRGNSNRHESLQPRIAISFVSSNPSFERPYLTNTKHYDAMATVNTLLINGSAQKGSREGTTSYERASRSIPPFHIRLLLVCSQLLIYYQRFNLSRDCLRSCYQYCKEHATELDETYWKKIQVEFVKSMRETSDSSSVNDQVADDQVDAGDSNSHNEYDPNSESSNIQDETGDGDTNQSDEEEDNILEAMLENASHSDINDDFDEMYDDEMGSDQHDTKDLDDDIDEDIDDEMVKGLDQNEGVDILFGLKDKRDGLKRKRPKT